MRGCKLIIVLLCLCSPSFAEQEPQSLPKQGGTRQQSPLRFVSYNVENLFDCSHDTLKNDSAFLPTGTYHWTKARFYHKIHNLSQVICNIGTDSTFFLPPTLIGLQEVENDSCLIKLLRHLPYEHFPYRFLHYESPDRRGIDVALLYDSLLVTPLCHRPIAVAHDSISRPTRDILYASLLLCNIDTIHCFVCHLPSQLGGAAQTRHRRQQVIDIIREHTDSILLLNGDAQIILMGDFNSSPQQNIPPLINLMYGLTTPIGTHKYQGRWEILDQIYVSPALLNHVRQAHIFSPSWLLEADRQHLGTRPKRTFVGPRYKGGYSDHLPVYVDYFQ